MNLNNTLQIKGRWETEMNTDIPQNMWEEICTEAHLVTNSNTQREFKWKVITPEIVAKMGPTLSNKCWRNCGTQSGNHTMGPLKSYSTKISQKIQKVAVLMEALKLSLQILLTAAIKRITNKPAPPQHTIYGLRWYGEFIRWNK